MATDVQEQRGVQEVFLCLRLRLQPRLSEAARVEIQLGPDANRDQRRGRLVRLRRQTIELCLLAAAQLAASRLENDVERERKQAVDSLQVFRQQLGLELVDPRPLPTP